MKLFDQLMFNKYFKNYTKSLLLLVCITIILFFSITVKYTVDFQDGDWIIGDYIYGFPFPFVYNGPNSLEYQTILIYSIIDFIIYFCFVNLIYFIFKKLFIILEICTKRINTICKILIIFLAVIITVFRIWIAISLHDGISNNLNYYGDLLKLNSVYIGFYWW